MDNKKDYLSAFAGIDESLISRSEEKKGGGRRKKAVIAVLCLCAVAAGAAVLLRELLPKEVTPGGTIDPEKPDVSAYVAASPVIPKQLKATADYNSPEFDAYWEQNRQRLDDNRTDFDFSRFYKATAESFLSSKDGKNKIYSPANVYIALSMLASCTDGETRSQILSVLGASSEDAARDTAMKLLRGNYVDNGSRKSFLTNSIWTGDKFTLNKENLQKISDEYYAPIMTGSALDKKYSKAFSEWLKTATGGLLGDDDFEFLPDMAVTLASALYFSAVWENEFSAENNKDGVFSGTAGEEKCVFLRSDGLGTYYHGEGFGAVAKSIGGGGYMLFILPDKGVSPEDIIGSDTAAGLMYDLYKNDSTHTIIHLSVPKFDISSDIKLKEGLEKLGVSDVFSGGKADFTPISDSGLFLSEIQHSARVAIDEKGITAAAYTIEQTAGAAPPEGEVDFTLDRPFIFAITGDTCDVLFTGIVNRLSND